MDILIERVRKPIIQNFIVYNIAASLLFDITFQQISRIALVFCRLHRGFAWLWNILFQCLMVDWALNSVIGTSVGSFAGVESGLALKLRVPLLAHISFNFAL